MDLAISAFSSITSKGVIKNGNLLHSNVDQERFPDYAKTIYKLLNISYPKFYKMDELCKLSFLAGEVLLPDSKELSLTEGADVAIVLGNKYASIASDQRHANAIADHGNYFPSPSVFVYTLPNIMLGELCIKHQITGENSCFLMDHLDARFLYRYVKDLFDNEQYRYCITGWVYYNEEDFAAHLLLVEEQKSDNKALIKFSENFDTLINI